MMKYYLTKIVQGRQEFLEIANEEYDQIVTSRRNLFQALFIEQKLDLIIENYVEYELELIKSTTYQMLFHNQSWAYYSSDINRIARRIVNLLTASRLYLDQIVHHLNNIYGSGNQKTEKIKEQKKAEREKSKSYRFIEALRNYVQHRGFPLNGCTYNSKKIDTEIGANGKLLYTITPYISIKELAEDKKFNKSVLKEIEGTEDKIDIKPIIRSFIASIGNIHDKVRMTMKSDIISWESCLLSFVRSFNTKFGLDEYDSIIEAAIYDENGLNIDSTSIFKDFIDHRKELEQKNRLLGSLPYRFLTSQSLKKDA